MLADTRAQVSPSGFEPYVLVGAILALAVAISYGLTYVVPSVYVWGGNACTGTESVVAVCGVFPVGFVLAFVIATVVCTAGMNAVKRRVSET